MTVPDVRIRAKDPKAAAARYEVRAVVRCSRARAIITRVVTLKTVAISQVRACSIDDLLGTAPRSRTPSYRPAGRHGLSAATPSSPRRRGGGRRARGKGPRGGAPGGRLA